MSPCDRHGNWGSETGRDLPRVTQLVKELGLLDPQIILSTALHGLSGMALEQIPSSSLTRSGAAFAKPPDMLLPPWPSASLLLTWGVSQGDVGAWV